MTISQSSIYSKSSVLLSVEVSQSEPTKTIQKRLSNLSEKLKQVNFDSPAKILQNKHTYCRFENIAPHSSASQDVEHGSIPGAITSNLGSSTPHYSCLSPSLSLMTSNSACTVNILQRHSPLLSTSETESTNYIDSSISVPGTPPRFIFKKPEYNSQYHLTHFHRHEKKKTILTELKKLFKKNSIKKRLLMNESNSSGSSIGSIHSDVSFGNEFNTNIQDRYGKWGHFVGKGSRGSVRIIRRSTDNKIFAVKKFRKRESGENEKQYVKKITAEFCLGSTFRHKNIIEVLDIVQEGQVFYQIMEYASTDLFKLVTSGKMTADEISCCWCQLLNGVQYLHSMGVAHRDIKLENILLDELGILKIIDFGCAAIFKSPFKEQTNLANGIAGSDPYIAPELYIQESYNACKADLWSCAVVFISMSLRCFPWNTTIIEKDKYYRDFVNNPDTLFKLLPHYARPVISKILMIDPDMRYTLEDVLDDEWVKSIECCSLNYISSKHQHHILAEINQKGSERGNIISISAIQKKKKSD